MEEEYKLEWHYLPELPPSWNDVLIAFKYDEFPIIGYYNCTSERWFGSENLKGWMRDGYCADSSFPADQIVAWAFLPYNPKQCRYPNE